MRGSEKIVPGASPRPIAHLTRFGTGIDLVRSFDNQRLGDRHVSYQPSGSDRQSQTPGDPDPAHLCGSVLNLRFATDRSIHLVDGCAFMEKPADNCPRALLLCAEDRTTGDYSSNVILLVPSES
jgi:hypothetical protein